MNLDHHRSKTSGPDEQASASALSRRSFLRAGAAAGGGLLLSLNLPFATGEANAAGADMFVPNAFVRIQNDGQIVLTMPYVEMGQGTYTSIPMLIAEELEVDLEQVRLEHAPPNEKLYVNPLLGVQATGGSNAIRGAWAPMRQAGAIARTMLVRVAARRWKVDPASCRAQSGEVVHTPTGRSAKYGLLAAEAAGMPVPESVTLKRPQDFKLIGTTAKRLDTSGKVNGNAVFGIDVRPPGVRIATLVQSPVFGGRVKSVDDAAAKAVKGVRQIVQLDDAVAVVADHMGAAKKGLEALAIEWDDGPNSTLTTAEIVAELEQATSTPGAVAQDMRARAISPRLSPNCCSGSGRRRSCSARIMRSGRRDGWSNACGRSSCRKTSRRSGASISRPRPRRRSSASTPRVSTTSTSRPGRRRWPVHPSASRRSRSHGNRQRFRQPREGTLAAPW
jgi:isoquinoline 1-oxidoreductase beta subunit